MKKVNWLQLIGLDVPNKRFSEMEFELQQHFAKEYLLAFLLLVADIAFAITSKMLDGTLIGFGCAVAYGLYISYAVMLVLCDKAFIFTGECVYIEKETKQVLKQQLFMKSQVSIRNDSDGFLYNVQVPHFSNFRTGNRIKVYASPSTVFQKNQDTVEIDSPIFVVTMKN